MEKLNIILFCDAFFPDIDGVVNVIDNHARLLTKLGHNVTIVAPRSRGYVDNFPYNVLRCRGTKRKMANYTVGFPAFDKKFKKALKNLPCDIIHIHSPAMVGHYGMKYAKKNKIPYIATFHSQFKRDIKKYIKFRFLTNLALKIPMKVYNNAQTTLIMNPGSETILKSYKYKGNCRIIPNATIFEAPDNIKSYEDLADEKFGLKDKQNVLIFIGRLVKQKNILFLAKVLKVLKDLGIEFTMCFVGGEGGRDIVALKNRIERYELNESVIFTGLITDKELVKAMFARADLFLFPSYYDVSSLVQIEAAAFKTPTVFIEGALTASAVIDNVNGFIAPNNLQLFAQKVFNVLNSKDELTKIGVNAKRDLYITWEQVVDKLDVVYKEVLKEYKTKDSKL